MAKQLNYQEKPKKISEKTKKEIKQARADIKAGKFYTHEQVKKRLCLKPKFIEKMKRIAKEKTINIGTIENFKKRSKTRSRNQSQTIHLGVWY